MKKVLSILLIMIFVCSCNEEEEQQVVNDFTGNYLCVKYTYESYYIPQIDSTIVEYDTANVVIAIAHCADPDSMIITLEHGGQVELEVKKDSTFNDIDTTGINIGGTTTSGAFFGPDSITIKRSYWSDTQYYHEYLYYGSKAQ